MKFICLLLFVSSFVISGKSTFAQQFEKLPDAPVPDTQSQNVAVHRRGAEKYQKYVELGQQVPSLSGRDKIVLAFREQAKPVAFVTPFLAAGWGQLVDANPHFGVDKAGFGERLGAAALKQSSQAILSDGFAAAALREDPRFYRMGGQGIKRRILYAASRVLITRTDSGNRSVNYSRLIGNAGAAALTMTYYPAVSANWETVWKGYGVSLSTAALGNTFREFSPDILHWIGRKHH